MAISPPSDIVLDVARAADPARLSVASARLGAIAADAVPFEATLAEAARPAATAKVVAKETPAASTSAPERFVRKEPAAKAGATYQDFEAMILASLFEAAMPENSAFFGEGVAGGTWKTFLVRQMADQMAKAGGIGIAAQVARSAQAALGDTDAAVVRDAARTLNVASLERGFLRSATGDDTATGKIL